MAIEKVGVYHKWLGSVPKDKYGNSVTKSQWPRKRRHCWIARWYGTNGQRYGKVFEKKEAQDFAPELQKHVSSGKADKPRKIMLHEFRIEHEKVMEGQVAYATVQEHKRALELFENFIGDSFTLKRIQPRYAEAFVADSLASQEVSIATVNKYIRTLKGIFQPCDRTTGLFGQRPESLCQWKLTPE